MKQTAVEWLIDTLSYKDKSGKICINIHPDCDITYEVKRAKQMEKEQIIDARIDGDENYTLVGNKRKEYAEQYYNETYGTDA